VLPVRVEPVLLSTDATSRLTAEEQAAAKARDDANAAVAAVGTGIALASIAGFAGLLVASRARRELPGSES
jgi:hypothetical protein